VSSLGLEVPSGAWADATSRRRLLVIGPLLLPSPLGCGWQRRGIGCSRWASCRGG
jgi:hypothetical protein